MRLLVKINVGSFKNSRIYLGNQKRPVNTKTSLHNKMQKGNLIDLQKLSNKEVKNWISSFDTVLTDCDGVLWLDNNEIRDSANVLNKLRELGKQIFYVTNNSTKTREEFVTKAKKLNFISEQNEFVSTSYLAAQYLKQKNVSKVYMIGSQGLASELEQVGIEHLGLGPDIMEKSLMEEVESIKLDPKVKAVVVGFDEHISYKKIMKAASYLENPDCLFVATNTDERFPVNNELVKPGTGVLIAAVQTAANRAPLIMGKPNTYIVEALKENFKIEPSRTLMIGDRCNTDILLGTRCGFQTLFVLSGVHTLNEVQEWKKSGLKEERDLVPDVYLPCLGDLLSYLN